MREWPIVKFWYGKGARYKNIEELIDKDPSWFIWAVERFQDITPLQAKHFQERYGMDIPEEYIRDVEPYLHTKESPPDEYQKVCDYGHLPPFSQPET